MFRPGIPLPSTDDDAGTGQPRPVEEDPRQPTAAERVRTLVESSVSAVLRIPGVEPDELGSGVPQSRAVTSDGDVVVLVPADSPAARAAAYAQDDDLTAVMEITDVAPVSVPHRIRGRAWVTGWLTAVRGADRGECGKLLAERHPAGPPVSGPGWMMLRLEVGEAYIDDLWGESQVEPDDFAAAQADPLVPHEADLLQHLAAAHSEQVGGLCALLGEREGPCAAGRRAVPLALDRFGLRVRYCGESDGFDARFEFPEPVADVAQLRRAMHRLFEAAAVE
ncbi:DUF2470 domain-containing protein [Streptomyces gobiensis]|uniref:DUF2470 domain-containing protein n=1 Tax=Streptomyces gobiensis TaxID=2875706 RepID=UPI001E4D7179|nr:DUF2470 domain-containing protein [Streptomyces gobiensis]UGY90390.1 DUF2470 domain-containing protein [Streptomyces gobiensis]